MSQQLYSQHELEAMTPKQFAAARERGFVRPPAVVDVQPNFVNPEHEQKMGEAIFGSGYTGPATPFVQPSLPPSAQAYAATSWSSPYYDFVVPSGQKCQMQKLRPEMLLGNDLLDKLTRLPAFAEEHIQQAEGLPPTPMMPEKEQIQQVLEVVDQLLPIVVVQPKVWPEPSDDQANDEPELDNSVRVPGRVYVKDIDIMDRVAILNRATRGVSMLDNFRKEA